MSKIAISGASTGTATFTIESPATSTNRTITLADATGTMVVSGTTPSLNGITFPATQVASAGANTLDDYEQGTWTVTLTPTGSGSITLKSNANLGSYTKIGRLVTITAGLDVDSVSMPAGAVAINLPINPASSSEREFFGGVSLLVNNSATNCTNYVALIEQTSNRIGVYLGNATGVSATSAGNIIASTEIFFTATYFAAD